MKRLSSIALFGTWIAVAISGAQAAVIIDPTTGLSGDFIFSNLGPVDSVNGVPGSTLTVTLSAPGTIDVHLEDTGQVGDVFALSLNGTTVTPTSTVGPGDFTGPFFEAFYEDIPLGAGLNTFEIFLTASCCQGGEALFEFSSVAPAAAVPEPATIGLLGAGLIGLGALRRRRTHELETIS